jgi:hypothetical protein
MCGSRLGQSSMDRRAFLSGLLGAVAGATLDPERLLWKPTKTIFIPPASTSIVMYKRFSVDFEWDTSELIMTMEDFHRRYIEPAIVNMFDHLPDWGEPPLLSPRP